MSYTKGKWVRQGAFIFSSESPPRLIAEVIRPNMNLEELQGNGDLIVAAVNGCIAVNSANPLAAAESIKEVYEALKLYRSHQQGTMGHFCWQCAEMIDKALLRAEGR